MLPVEYMLSTKEVLKSLVPKLDLIRAKEQELRAAGSIEAADKLGALIKAIEVSARAGGADVSGNPTLFDAIAKAKKNSVPADNIDRAVKRGAGLETGGKEWETIMYEGYAAG